MNQKELLCYFDVVADSSRANQRNQILKLLLEKEFVKTSVLRMIAYQYNARIYELRKMGYDIIACRNTEGIYGFMIG